MEKILIIEDDENIRDIVSFNLEHEGYTVDSAGSAEEGLPKINRDISLIILDVMLPGMSGFDLAHALRSRKDSTPIIFLTARTDQEDLLNGFRSGGDDYICKPFSKAELIARIKAVLRRSAAGSVAVHKCGPLTMDLDAGTATLDGKEIVFSRKEFDILALLIRNQGSYFSRNEIIRQLWVDAPYVVDRTVDVHVTHIRNKLGECKDILVSRTGFGYSLIYER